MPNYEYMREKQASLAPFRRIGKDLIKGLKKSMAIGEGAIGAAKKGKNAKKGLNKLLTDHPALGVLGIGAVLGASVKAEDAIRHGVGVASKKKHLNKAINFDPDVGRWHKAQPVAVEARFNTLYKFNPMAAKDPLVASSWIKQTMEFPAVTPQTVIQAMTPVKAMPKKESIVMEAMGGKTIGPKATMTALGIAAGKGD